MSTPAQPERNSQPAQPKWSDLINVIPSEACPDDRAYMVSVVGEGGKERLCAVGVELGSDTLHSKGGA